VAVQTARSSTEAIHKLQDLDFDVVVSGHKPPDLDGIALLERSCAYRPDAIRVLSVATPAQAAALDDRPASAAPIFRAIGRRGEGGNLLSIVGDGLKLIGLVKEQRQMVAKLGIEYDRLQKREKLLDVVVRERTKELRDSYEHLKAANRQALFGLAEAIEAKDSYTKGHCGRVAGYALALAEAAGYPQDGLETLEFGAFLHDIGKIGVRDAVLLKPGPLDDDEWLHMREHPVKGYEIAKQIQMLHPIMPAVRNHHERWDGDGYPDRLRGTDIPLSARLVAIADAYDALATDRPYKSALPLDQSEAILRKNAGKMFDPDLVELFCSRHIGALYRTEYEDLDPPGADEVGEAADAVDRAETVKTADS